MKTWRGTIAKVEPDKQQVFGWLYQCETADGQRIIDHSGEWVAPDTLEVAAYEFVLDARTMGNAHERVCPSGHTFEGVSGDEEQKCPVCGSSDVRPVRYGRLIESIMLTREKVLAMGIPVPMPVGWWVGFQIDDADVWKRVKSGELSMFSFGGTAERVENGRG